MIDQKQFPGHLGVTIELCAGIVDKGLSLLEIARAEVLEECGYNVPADRFCKITSCRYNLQLEHIFLLKNLTYKLISFNDLQTIKLS